jgi:hypothetical protein
MILVIILQVLNQLKESLINFYIINFFYFNLFLSLLNINIHSPAIISGLLYVFTIVVGSFVAVTPLCYNITVIAEGNDTAAAARGNDTIAATRGSSTIATAGDSLPDNSKLLLILTSVVKGF